MSGLRRSTRGTTSTINVKLNEKNEIEYFKVENEDDALLEHTDVDNDDDVVDDIDEDEEMPDEQDDGEEEEEEEEEELIVNPDGTMTIKMPEKKPKPKKVPLHHICAKCSKVLSSSAVSTPYLAPNFFPSK